MSDDRRSDPDIDYAPHAQVQRRADALAGNTRPLDPLADQSDKRDTGQAAVGGPRWRAYAIAVVRIALLVVGIPLVWIYRTELDWSIWRAVSVTVVLVLLAAVWNS
ncbi:hypothetical protein E3G68_005110 [Mycobacteroides abscessus]|uniref:hypothetical protein n=1 Tax=Mycobacteroides abscessus TaxID=36809 RepID=UPI00187864D6|nr:hypothetical protein [Mycobacteroides abscessus]